MDLRIEPWSSCASLPSPQHNQHGDLCIGSTKQSDHYTALDKLRITAGNGSFPQNTKRYLRRSESQSLCQENSAVVPIDLTNWSN